MEYLERKTAKIEKQDAENAVELINALWEKWNVAEKTYEAAKDSLDVLRDDVAADTKA
jgi:hypothetical protein